MAKCSDSVMATNGKLSMIKCRAGCHDVNGSFEKVEVEIHVFALKLVLSEPVFAKVGQVGIYA